MKLARILVMTVAIFALTGTSQAWFLDFEWGSGHDFEHILSGVPGLTFTDDYVYADAPNPTYFDVWNMSSDNGGQWGSGEYWIFGNVAAFSTTGVGRMDFVNGDGSWFTTGYSSYSDFWVEAYDINDNLLDMAHGVGNLRYTHGNGDGMDFLTVSSAANDIAYILMHDSYNYWVTDNMSGDASGVYDPSIPEPATMSLLGLGLLGMGATIRRRMKK